MPRKQPTARQERLGCELRKMREAAGLTAREAARLLGAVPVTMSQIESGVTGVSEARLRRMAANYGCRDGELIDALVKVATDRTRGWWEEYREVLGPAFANLAELDHHAHRMTVIGTSHVPGLFQTEEYARAIFTYWRPDLDEGEVQLRAEHRIRRATVLTRAEAVPYTAIMHEAVLRTRVADRRVARAQLDHILRLSELPHVTVRTIPLDVDGFGGGGAGMLYAAGPVAALDTVQMDTPSGPFFVHEDAQLRRLRRIFSKAESLSLDAAKARELILRLVKEL
ncbi:helix-turn-helix transcriptional regulator [Streptomyces sp. NPDC004732]|uniref:helix-turn-helix domain-containing protein n=1 Tax=Streptomyces sp. NPDC004732 TaxID=3154290 RepID=UPI0033A75032